MAKGMTYCLNSAIGLDNKILARANCLPMVREAHWALLLLAKARAVAVTDSVNSGPVMRQ
jgi:hypothetical protein